MQKCQNKEKTYPIDSISQQVATNMPSLRQRVFIRDHKISFVWDNYWFIFVCSFEENEEFLRLAYAELTVQLNARGLVIETASPRRESNEGSLEKRWGLGILVQSNEWFCSIKVERHYNRSLSARYFSRALIHSMMVRSVFSLVQCSLTGVMRDSFGQGSEFQTA